MRHEPHFVDSHNPFRADSARREKARALVCRTKPTGSSTLFGGDTSTIILGQCWPIKLPPTAKAVLISLADQANDAGVCWPSVGTLTKRTCLSERACQRALLQLQATGHISKEERAGRSTVFKVHPVTDTPVTQTPPTHHHPRQAGTPGGATQTPGGATQTPRTVTEPSVESKRSGRAKGPSPVAACFQAYQAGIKAKYRADYPPSAKANGQIAQVVGRLGGEPALAVVGAYLASQEPFYGRVKHSLGFLVRDCEKLWLELQASTGSAKPEAPTTCRVALLADDGHVIRELEQQPAGDMLEIAKAAARDYGRLIAQCKPKYLGVRQGGERRRYPLEELR